MKPSSSSDDWLNSDQALDHIMRAMNCSRETALQELRKAIDDGRIAVNIVVAEDV